MENFIKMIYDTWEHNKQGLVCLIKLIAIGHHCNWTLNGGVGSITRKLDKTPWTKPPWTKPPGQNPPVKTPGQNPSDKQILIVY